MANGFLDADSLNLHLRALENRQKTFATTLLYSLNFYLKYMFWI